MAHRSRHDPGGDPFVDVGFWGSPSSTANFCEEDYGVTVYVCEFFNTLTNLAYVYYGLTSPRAPGRRGVVFGMDAMAVSLVLVGVFSALFHATLHREAQFLDEMSMFLLGSALLHPLYTHGLASRAARAAAAAGLAAAVAAVSAAYYRTRVVELHWGAFFAMQNLIWPRALHLVRAARPGSRPHARLARRFWAATGLMALALLLWAVDLELCPPLRGLRARVGRPWAHLLELHAWWHVLTAVSAAEYIRLVREICP